MDLHGHRAANTAAACRTHASLSLLRGLHACARRRSRRPRRPLRPGSASFARRLISGASRDRTGDLCHAMAALSQLSYGPAIAKCSGELEVFGPVEASLLIVPRWCKTKLNCAPAAERRDRREIAPIHLRPKRRFRTALLTSPAPPHTP